jgi:hypothetical protein
MNISKTLVVAIKTDCVFCEVGIEVSHNIYTTFMGGACNTYGGRERCVHGFGGET